MVPLAGIVRESTYSSFGASRVITTGSNTKYIVVQFNNSSFPDCVNAVQLESGSLATTYEPYTNTIYGGYVDPVRGVAVVSNPKKTFIWSNGTNETAIGEGYKRRRFYVGKTWLTGSANNICDIAKYGTSTSEQSSHFYLSQFDDGTVYAYFILPNDTSADTEITIVGKYSTSATPVTYQVTPQQIQTLIGTNTIWSDTNGSNTAIYLKR